MDYESEDRIERARHLYDQAVFGGDTAAIAAGERELDAVEAGTALARGRLLHARFLADRQQDPYELTLFERAVELYERLGDLRGLAEALFWTGTFHQVVREDTDAAVPLFERSYRLSGEAGDKLTQSYAARHLGFVEWAGGRADAARERLEESVRLRREIGFLPGVAAGVLAPAEHAAVNGRQEEAETLLEEAVATAEASGAHGVLRWADGVRAEWAQN